MDNWSQQRLENQERHFEEVQEDVTDLKNQLIKDRDEVADMSCQVSPFLSAKILCACDAHSLGRTSD